MKKRILIISCLLSSLLTSVLAQKTPIYKDASQPVEKRVQDLLARMTAEEKVAQLLGIWVEKRRISDKDNIKLIPDSVTAIYPHGIGQIARPYERQNFWTFKTPSQTAIFVNDFQKVMLEKTRLGIPAIMHAEALHGLQAGWITSFPQPIALACSFNPELIEKLYAMTAKEARAMGCQTVLTPVLDVARDPRWGRVEETYGEDPYLNAVMGVACITGFQGKGKEKFDQNHVGATVKHFAAHGQADGGRNIAPVQFGERYLREVHLMPFRYGIMKAEAMSVMASYNDIDGVPSHASDWLLNKMLRQEWGFKGFVVSDYFAIHELESVHNICPDKKCSAQKALEAGVDVELPDPSAFPLLVNLAKNKQLNKDALDKAVARVLRAKFELGLFEQPFVKNVEEADKICGSDEHRKLALQAARESIVLLKNEKNVLPINLEKVKRIAVIGPNAEKLHEGGYSGDAKYKIPFLEGIKNFVGNKAEVLYAKGCYITKEDGDWFADLDLKNVPTAEEDLALMTQAVQIAKQADVVVLCLGENESIRREAWDWGHKGDRADLNLFGRQAQLLRMIEATGKPVILVLTNGAPISLTHDEKYAHAIVETWYLGQEAGNALADVLFGAYNPSGKLTISLPRSVGHIPAFYSVKKSGTRGYVLDTIAALYPFGFGLSYTTFECSNVRLQKNTISTNESVKVYVDVKNTGSLHGEEVIQLYIRDDVSSVTKPLRELRDFKKIGLNPGETQTVTLELTPEKLALWDINMKFTVEPGTFTIYVGTSSNATLSTQLIVK